MPTCKKCGCQFPYNLIIDGVAHNLHGRRHCLTCAPFKSNNREHLWLNASGNRLCHRCKKSYPYENFYNRAGSRSNRKTAYCKSCMTESLREHRRKVKKLAVDYKGGKCVLCGYSKCIFSLEFHHPDMTKKEFSISQKRIFSSRIKHELDKCVLVCVNCHRELHYGEAFLPQDI